MIAIRFGTYTIYKNIEMSITEYYGHGLDREIEQNHRIISYPKEYGLINGFMLDESCNLLKKDILVKDLKNAFFIETKASYKGTEVSVYNFFAKEKAIGVTTYSFIEDSNFIKSVDQYGMDYYIGMIELSEIESIWEERTKSEYDLPMPDRVERKKIIFQNDIP